MDQKEIEQFKDYLLSIARVGNRTCDLYLNYCKSIDLELLPHQEYVDAFIQEHKNHSVIRGMMLNLLKHKGLHKVLELPQKRSGTIKERVARPISKEDIETLRKGLYNKSYTKGLMFDLIYQGALRRSEVLTIKIGSFRWAEWIEDVSKMCNLAIIGKGDKERTVLINPETAEMILKRLLPHGIESLDQIKRLRNSQNLLFSRKNGDPLTEKQVYDIIKRGSKKFLGRDVRPHELRHCRANELLKSGVPIRNIKNYLGHSSQATTEIYLHQNEQESLELIEKNLMGA
jgi:site-specific recombinase XerD